MSVGAQCEGRSVGEEVMSTEVCILPPTYPPGLTRIPFAEVGGKVNRQHRTKCATEHRVCYLVTMEGHRSGVRGVAPALHRRHGCPLCHAVIQAGEKAEYGAHALLTPRQPEMSRSRTAEIVGLAHFAFESPGHLTCRDGSAWGTTC